MGSRNGGEVALRLLLFRHLDAMGQKLVSEGSGPWLHHATKWAQGLVSHKLDDDPEYETELQAIKERFRDDKKPADMRPEQWGYLRRLDEMEAITRHINARGAFKEHRTPVDDQELL